MAQVKQYKFDASANNELTYHNAGGLVVTISAGQIFEEDAEVGDILVRDIPAVVELAGSEENPVAVTPTEDTQAAEGEVTADPMEAQVDAFNTGQEAENAPGA